MTDILKPQETVPSATHLSTRHIVIGTRGSALALFQANLVRDLLAATGVAAVVYPVWIATRLPIAATLRLETVS